VLLLKPRVALPVEDCRFRLSASVWVDDRETPLWTILGRVDLIDADARIRSAP
jgi:hypothetical protein